MMSWFARHRVALWPLLLVVSLLLGSCEAMHSLTGGEQEAEPQPAKPPAQVTHPQPAPPSPPKPQAQPPAPEPQVAQPQTVQPPREGPVKVALLLPLSGRLGNLGKAMSDAAQMAVFDIADRHMQLVLLDDKGTPDGAAAAAKNAVAEGATLIIGPLLASSVRAVAPVSAAAGIPVIAFSSDRKVAGPNVFIIGFTPEAEVERVVRFAAARGLSRFAAVAPDDAYGNAVSDALRRTVAATGARVVQVQLYPPGTQDFSDLIRRLVPQPDQPAVPPGSTAAATSGTVPSPAPSPPAPPVAVPPVPTFDALLIAEGGPQLRAIATGLAAVGVSSPGVQLLGTGKWDEPGLGTETSLVGAWFAAPVPDYRQEFETRYRRAFGQSPPRLATLAYDATALAALLARGPEQNPFTTSQLTDPNGFFGRDGLFRLTTDGIAERRLAILRVDRGGVTVLDEPPRSFAAGS